MPLVTSKEMFEKAYKGGYAIGAFNVNNMEIIQGITGAAADLKAPVILQVSKGARAYANRTYLMKLVEAAVIQWLWKEDVFPSHDQFNSIHEKMVESWKYIHERYQCGRYYFASISDCLEDNATLGYIISTAFEAGLVPYELDIRSIRHENGSLFAPDGMPIDCMFKLYPWEFMFAEDLTGCMTEMCWIEPLWKALMSDKAMLPMLYEMFPRSPYILPAYAEPGKLGAYCKKPVFSREGANVELVKNGTILESSSGGYGKEGYIYQQLVDIPCFDGRYPVLGSWVIGGEAAGMGIRENTSRITDDMSHFVPHIIV